MRECHPAQNHLHCPNCGARRRPRWRAAARYCRARLATVTCAACFALDVRWDSLLPRLRSGTGGSRYSGVGAAVPRLHERSSSTVAAAGTLLLECRTCDGVWLDAAQFEQICASRESRAALLAASTRQPRHGNRATDQVPPMRALRQDDEPRQFWQALGDDYRRLPRTRHVPRRGELHAIVTFIQGGGLESGAPATKSTDLKEARRQLDAAKSSHRRTRQSTALGSERWDAPSLSDLMAAIFGR